MIAWIVRHFVFASRPVVIEGLGTTLFAMHKNYLFSIKFLDFLFNINLFQNVEDNPFEILARGDENVVIASSCSSESGRCC